MYCFFTCLYASLAFTPYIYLTFWLSYWSERQLGTKFYLYPCSFFYIVVWEVCDFRSMLMNAVEVYWVCLLTCTYLGGYVCGFIGRYLCNGRPCYISVWSWICQLHFESGIRKGRILSTYYTVCVPCCQKPNVEVLTCVCMGFLFLKWQVMEIHLPGYRHSLYCVSLCLKGNFSCCQRFHRHTEECGSAFCGNKRGIQTFLKRGFWVESCSEH